MSTPFYNGYVSARVNERQHGQLCRIAEEQKRSVSQIVRFAIEEYLNGPERKEEKKRKV